MEFMDQIHQSLQNSKNIKVIILTDFDEFLDSDDQGNHYKTFFLNMEKQNYKFDSIYLSIAANIHFIDVNYTKDVFKFMFDHMLSMAKCVYIKIYNVAEGMTEFLENCLESFGINLTKVIKDEKINDIMLVKTPKDAIRIEYGVNNHILSAIY